MSRKYKFYNTDQLYFVTPTIVEWVDIFTRDIYRDIIVESLKFCMAKKDLQLYAWVIMTNHLHLIISSRGNKLENIMRDFKRHTSEKIHEVLKNNITESRKKWMLDIFEKAGKENSNNINFQLWQQHNQPYFLDTYKKLNHRLQYLHLNPVRAGFTDVPEGWKYSSAKNYYGLNGMIDVLLIEPEIEI
jgi:putative transposase